jgi:hypothetical protein
MAEILMNNSTIIINKAKYRIAEIEFYLKSDMHNDKYTHAHKLQKKSGRWYFHGSGIDITFGNSDMFGGILIRAIYNCNNDIKEAERYIYGPINVVTELFSNLDSISKGNFDFGIIEEDSFQKEVIIKAPRVGLNQTKQPEKYNSLYRFLIMPKKKHSEKRRIAESMKEQNIDEETINKIWG